MGRRKIEIARISNERHRHVTFSKRKSGLIKKATELAVLCDAQVALLVFAPNQRVTVYSSSPIEGLLQRFSEYKDTPEMHTNDDYFRERAHRESLEADGGRTQRARAASDGGAPALLAGDSAPTLAASVVPFATATAGVPAVAMQTAHAVFPQMAQATVLSAGAIQPAQAQQQFAVANVTALEQASASPQVAQATVAQITPAQVQPIAQAFNGQAIPLMAQPISQPVEVASVAAATSSATFATSSGDEPANKKARLDADDADDSATSSLPVAEAVQAPAEPHVQPRARRKASGNMRPSWNSGWAEPPA